MSLFEGLSPFLCKKLSESPEISQGPGGDWTLKLGEMDLVYNPTFLQEAQATQLWDELRETDASGNWKNIPWKQDKIKLFGKEVLIPRLSAWHGDPGAAYSYSGLQLQPQPWTQGLNEVREALREQYSGEFNSVLLNWYRDGKDHMGWHSDDEPELGSQPLIASVNLGASRRFLLRFKRDHSQKIEIFLSHGSLLLMRGSCQELWQHSVPKQLRVPTGRINLTFRKIILD